MKALVTGGAGFIGSHIADALLARGYEVRVLDSLEPRVHPNGLPAYVSCEIDFIQGDVRDRATLERALTGIDAVFHQAAYQDYMPDYGKFFHSNVVSTALLLELIREKRLPVQKIVVASSQSVYGEGQYECATHRLILPEARPIEQLDRGDWDLRCPRCQGRATAGAARGVAPESRRGLRHLQIRSGDDRAAPGKTARHSHGGAALLDRARARANPSTTRTRASAAFSLRRFGRAERP